MLKISIFGAIIVGAIIYGKHNHVVFKIHNYRDHVNNGDCWTCEKRSRCPYSKYDE